MVAVFYGVCALVHLALAATLGSSIVFFLFDGMDFVTTWPTHLAKFWAGLWNERQRYFAFCVLGNVLLLPLVVGLMDARMLRHGRRAYGTFLMSGAFFLLFALAMFLALALKPFLLSHLGMITFFMLIILVGIWNVAYIPISILAHLINARIYRLMFAEDTKLQQ
jgi:hypothetical protein